MRLTPLGYRVITAALLLVTAFLLWAVLARLPLYDGISLTLTFGIIALVALVIYTIGSYLIEYAYIPKHAPRNEVGV